MTFSSLGPLRRLAPLETIAQGREAGEPVLEGSLELRRLDELPWTVGNKRTDTSLERPAGTAGEEIE